MHSSFKYLPPPMGCASFTSCANLAAVVALPVLQTHILMYWSLPLSKVQLAWHFYTMWSCSCIPGLVAPEQLSRQHGSSSGMASKYWARLLTFHLQYLVVLFVSCASAQYGHQGRPGYGQDQCVVDNIQKYGDVCIPTLHTVSRHQYRQLGLSLLLCRTVRRSQPGMVFR